MRHAVLHRARAEQVVAAPEVPIHGPVRQPAPLSDLADGEVGLRPLNKQLPTASRIASRVDGIR